MFRPRISLVLGIFSLSILALSACGASTNLEPAPDIQFSLYQGEEVLGGKDLRLSDLQGKPLVLNFWAGLCIPCLREMPEFQEFYEEYGDRVTLLGLDIGSLVGLGSPQYGRDRLKKLKIGYPAGSMSDPRIVVEHKVLPPTTLFITSDGKIFRKWRGGLLNRDKLVEITEEMLAAVPGGGLG